MDSTRRAGGKRSLPTRWRMAMIASAGVLLAMAAAIIAFNYFEDWQLGRESEASLEEAIGWRSGDAPLATRTVEIVPFSSDGAVVNEYLDGEIDEDDRGSKSDGEIDEDDRDSKSDGEIEEGGRGNKPNKGKGDRWEDGYDVLSWFGYTELENELAAWCAASASAGQDVVQRVSLEHGTCYVRVVHDMASDDDSVLLAVYVDVTSQVQLMHMVNLAFAAIALLSSVGAAWFGWRVGKNVEEATEAQKRFYENMSHELKTPLAAIRGYAEGSLAGVVEPAHANEAIVRESERMTRQIEQILDLSRLEAGAVTPCLESVQLAEFVQDCLMPFEGIVRMRCLDVRLDLADVVVRADSDLLEHALENVLSNAMRHAASFVAVRCDSTTLAVENDGAIPSQEELDNLFDRFHVGTGGSSGVGLALTREIVTLHGWQIDASRTPDTLCITIVFA